ncbi:MULTISPECIES: patatin-like phospholipase family protein [unclassified Bradyrhizobium]|uniref:patatin-like phospholipase family protein n=1 Tax=unclassified Bradyrhizobium TaxID=2631580 RepID=UPI0028ED4BAF|nr:MULTISPECIES: patatin-like phospholipase family protein [unclassified Bradyrhizobium]
MDQPLTEKFKVGDLWPFAKKNEPSPQDWASVKKDELNWIRCRRELVGARIKDGDERELQLSALCLSGGGIRSAAFALGVIQALATKRLLKHFDYLSTVSGGGYVGGFLTAWVQRTKYDAVEQELDLTAAPTASSPLSHLRNYSRYLTPHSGLFSADTLTLVALFTRNLLLNWMIILPFVVTAILVVKAGAMGVWLMDKVLWLHAMPALLASIALALIGISLVDSLRQRPGWETDDSKDLQFTRHELIPMMTGTFVAMLAAATTLTSGIEFNWRNLLWSVIVTGGVIGLTVWLVALYFARDAKRREQETGSVPKRGSTKSQVATETAKRYVALTAAGVTAMGVTTGLVAALAIYAFPLVRPDWIDRDVAIIVFTPPLAVAALFCGELVYTGMTSSTPWSDAEREWLARAAGYHALIAGTYVIATALVLFGSQFVFWFTNNFAPTYGPKMIAAAGGVSGILIAVFSKTPSTAALVQEKVYSWTAATYRLILAAATPIFLASLAMLISWKFDELMFGEALTKSYFFADVAPPPPLGQPLLHTPGSMELGCATALTITIALLFAVIGLVAAYLININRFSLHNVYRNRLVRAFLGASHLQRQETANSFTDLDDHDNIRLCEIWPNPLATEGEPTPNVPNPPPQFLVVNMALNTLASGELQLQERKAMSFFATPLSIGTADKWWTRKAGEDQGDVQNLQGCFRPAATYNRGMSLGTAVTISGAAASPNMGYHSSASLGVLMTMFNVRLGMWAGNPGPEGGTTFQQNGPRPAFVPLYREAMGLTTADDSYVYLSDGGHFENLGVYEMIRRGCKFILVSDAGCDPKYGYEDLGNLVRRVSIDFGVCIKFRPPLEANQRSSPYKGECCALADIYYPATEADRKAMEAAADPEARRELEELRHGLLLYVKPGIYGSEPTSVMSYHNDHPEFPHESTTNQWFGETQFEAYRALGAFVMGEALKASHIGKGTEIADLFGAFADKYPD